MAFVAEAMPHSTLAGIILGNNVMLILGIGLSTYWLTLWAFAGLLIIVWLGASLAGDPSFAMIPSLWACLSFSLPLGCSCYLFCHRP